MRKFILEFHRAPGDVLMLTSLVRDLKLTYGNQYAIDVRTQYPGIWRHNPYTTPLGKSDSTAEKIQFGGEGPNAADRIGIGLSKESAGKGKKLHYCTVFHKAFQQRTGIRVDPLFSRPDLHLSESEKANPVISGRYWIVVPGGKTDITTKWWPEPRWQEVVDKLRPWGLQFVQEGATKPRHSHPPLNNVLNTVGKTSIRDLIVNIYHAEGVICGCSFPMHVAGALEKPCVVLMGGREEPAYEEYSNNWGAFGSKAELVKVPHRMLHTVGLLDCCQKGGCWLQRVERLNDGYRRAESSLCKRPLTTPDGIAVAECMSMISSDLVAEAVMSYYEDGTLPSP